MSLNDADIELLSAYLDGELPVGQCEGIWRRLAAEPDLAAELDRMRADAAMRNMVWASLEMEDEVVAGVEAGVLRSARRRQVLAWARRAVAVTTTAAACILFGFTAGWLGHDRYIPAGAGGTGMQTATVSPVNNSSGKYVVDVSDTSGRVLAEQEFGSLDEAQQFARELARAQSSWQQDQSQGHDAAVVPAIDRF